LRRGKEREREEKKKEKEGERSGRLFLGKGGIPLSSGLAGGKEGRKREREKEEKELSTVLHNLQGKTRTPGNVRRGGGRGKGKRKKKSSGRYPPPVQVLLSPTDREKGRRKSAKLFYGYERHHSLGDHPYDLSSKRE